ncbi:family 20 glycosylhydrolase [Paradevosia shaoguanensis]|uniref:beta-N-acetylhexosaminidase n=1 Tax=Paradevosia shaoguanensis TaxID=1335043 RepID=A0AA41QK56_9HYPH|nr:family 20 glycosylhydrolase [Paradevosia shaoguanensis]MCF1741884.1 beta-N-acetylhexosaminidase [Paradevosia shaoguanensis]MCI0126367.1 beta-N-acetylhexosaminidase [Paradevosia shaoguanensis]
MPSFSLVTTWTPAKDGEPLGYGIELTNTGSEPVSGFQLGFSGPARIDPHATLENGKLLKRLSNHTLIAPPDGYVLEPGQTWTATARGLSYGLRHWSDGANSGYVVLADGTVVVTGTAPTKGKGHNAPLLKGAAKFPVPAKAAVPVSIIPWPKSVATTGARIAPPGFDLKPEGEAANRAAAAFAGLVDDLFPVEALVRPASEAGMPVSIVEKAGMGPEAYEVAFGENSATVSATTRQGMFYGLVTLGHILRGARQYPQTFLFPTGGTITDEPAFEFRGSHLDVARQFYTGAEVMRLIKLMSWNKMNKFHWHLTEDEAWRLEIDAYPQLTEIAAWRGHGKALPPLLGSGPQPTGGYYSKDVVRQVVALADSLGIAVIPEIDMPGHFYAALQALPELRDPAEKGEYQSVQGFPNNSLNPAHEPVYKFVETVVDEVLELFPANIFHLGADEVPLAAWSGSPLALDMIEKLAGPAMRAKHEKQFNQLGNHHGADEIEGSPTAVLQSEFIKRVHKYIASKGAITGGWEEAAHGDAVAKESSYVIGWRNVEINKALAARGFDIVVSPGQRYYLDMANGISWAEPGAGWAGWSGPQETYEFDAGEGWGPEELKHLKGVQSCIWSESMTDRAIFDRLVFPRLSAVAEAGWTPRERKSWNRFKDIVGLMPIMYGNWAAE